MQSLTLTSNRLLRITLEPGRQLRCAHGCLWLTFNGEDVILRTGEYWTAPGHGLALFEAYGGTAQLHLDPQLIKYHRPFRATAAQPTFGGLGILKRAL
ncbi:DUF2917 domain-containing protein [Jeongeupia naejangsanensis]|uniref:DUF2917 domain-containing protein n=1 Tax=Jeongeupia naejangsanensis TaxID=613195 RepID=A0ABS2BFE2_9NEIS|nr:DUF2917 domain-containing protein [Jeongeupia naejangsanensis]MBM3114315.1 DUF2917 domain-containing protein [Jeongeupia naejangsanensis]